MKFIKEPIIVSVGKVIGRLFFATKDAFCRIFQNLQNYLTDFLKKLQNFAINRKMCKIFAKFPDFCKKKSADFAKIADFLQKSTNFLKIEPDSFVDLEKPEKMSSCLLS